MNCHKKNNKKVCDVTFESDVANNSGTPDLSFLTTDVPLERLVSPKTGQAFVGEISCAEDDEVDTQLAEELLDYTSSDNCSSDPIPLLTPPVSPVPVKSDENIIKFCEWPSNLAVDNAMTAAMRLRVLSPSSLARLEEVEYKNLEQQEPIISSCPQRT